MVLSTPTAGMLSLVPAPTSVPMPRLRWHAVWSTSTRISLSRRQRQFAKPSSPTSPRLSTSSFATAPTPSPRKTKPTLPLSAVLMAGKSHYLSTVTMKSMTSSLTYITNPTAFVVSLLPPYKEGLSGSLRFNNAKPPVSQ